jgi:hypothetical protein
MCSSTSSLAMYSPNHKGFACAFTPLVSPASDSPDALGLAPDPKGPDNVFPVLMPSMLRIDGAGELTREVGLSGGVEGGVDVDDDDL